MADSTPSNSEPGLIEISEELLPELSESATSGSLPLPKETSTTKPQTSTPAAETKTEPKTDEKKEEAIFQPLREGEVEIPMVQKGTAPILPEEVLAREMPKFRSQIQRSYEPGFTLESKHFLVEADSWWNERATQLKQVVQLAEETRFEAELTTSLWRKPLFTFSNPRDLNVSMVPARRLESGGDVLQPDFSGERIRLRVVNPEELPEGTDSCHFALTDDGPVLMVAAENILDFSRTNFRQNLRREVFHSTLNDGHENQIFPLWLKNGLADVFAGQEAAPSPRNENLRFQLSLLNAPEVEGGETAVSVIRYGLTSNDGKAFFPFWEQLGEMYSAGSQSLRDLRGNRFLSVLNPWIRENQQNSQAKIERFFSDLEANPQNETFTMWQKSLTSASGGDAVRVFWSPEVQVLNEETPEGQPLPRLGLDESWKAVFLEMAQILKFTANFQDSRENGVSQRVVHGMVIQEFGKSKTFTPSSAPEPSKGEGSQEKAAEDSRDATAEDLQKLENVLEWLEKKPQTVLALNRDGSVFSPCFAPNQLQKLFHPKDRAYLLQEYEGNQVLTATFKDDYVLHVLMEKSSQPFGIPEIRVLGIEKPEKSENQNE